MFSKAIIATTLLTAVSAHQNWHQLWINDETPGYHVGIRMPPSNSPVTDVTSDDMACNVGGSKVPSGVETVEAKEGDSIKVQWDPSGHPGPITHFLFGPVDDASQATGIGAGWFKIDELDNVDGKWANEIMQASNMTHEFKLPTGLQSGEYLLRSEMLALHGAQSVGGGQFYMGCAQLKIAGTGTGTCGPSIELPGAYNENDENIFIPNIYNGFDVSSYTAPGGPIASCGGASGSTPTVPSTPKPASSSAVAVTPTQAPAQSSVVASPVASASAVVASASPVASTSPVATASPVASAVPSEGAGEGASGDVPSTFTLDTFIAWLEAKTSGSSKVRRHARAF